MARSLALLALSGAAMAAQSTTVSLLLPFADPQIIVGSVIGADSTATTYAYGCAPGQPAAECGFETSQTVTQGPTTWAYTNTYSGDGGVYTESGRCKLSSAVDVASCSVFMGGIVSGSIVASGSVGTESFLSFQLPVTITAGLDKLKATPSASATDDSTATPGASATNDSTAAPTNTGASETSQTTASSGTASSSAASTTLARQTTATSTGSRTASTTAAPSSTNAAGLVNAQSGLLAGVAALVGGVMML
ncbi:hypothetical protein GGI35DRAFT_430840 [Trichoderma velutinum]